MAKQKILGFELDGLPTVGENAEKMGQIREKLTMKVHMYKMKGIASIIEKRKQIEASKEDKREMKNVTPDSVEKKDGKKGEIIDATFRKVEEKKKEITGKKEEI